MALASWLKPTHVMDQVNIHRYGCYFSSRNYQLIAFCLGLLTMIRLLHCLKCIPPNLWWNKRKHIIFNHYPAKTLRHRQTNTPMLRLLFCVGFEWMENEGCKIARKELCSLAPSPLRSSHFTSQQVCGGFNVQHVYIGAPLFSNYVDWSKASHKSPSKW